MHGISLTSIACLLLAMGTPIRAADRDYVENSDFTKTVGIAFSGTSAAITNGADVTIAYGSTTSRISITSAVRGVEYILSGTTSDGYVEITSTHPAKITLNGATLTSTDGPAVSVFSSERAYLVLPTGTTSQLTDSANYTRAGTGTLYVTGPLIVGGNGALRVSGMKGHGIHGKDYIRCLGGEVKILTAAKDAIHAKDYFRMDHGKLDLAATGDGIDGDTGFVTINGGSISVRSTVADTKCVTCDGDVTINGGALDFTVTGTQSKGISSKGNIALTGGSALMNLSGSVYLATVTGTSGTYVDPSYCTAVKCDGNVSVSGGSFAITHTGVAGKGISTGGNISVTGGTLDIATSGAPSTSYTNSLGVSDMATADCLKADGTLTIDNGTVTTLSSGVSGDCLSSDLALTINGGMVSTTVSGASGDCIASPSTLAVTGGTLVIVCKGNQSKGLKSTGAMTIAGGSLTFAMTGAVVLEATATAGRYDPSYCSAIKAESALNISNGTITVTHSGTAGKAVTADGNIAISGGTLNLTVSGAPSAAFTNSSGTSDIAAGDCLTADGTLTITGGTITASATGSGCDGISSDGAMTLGTAGVANTPVISSSATGTRATVATNNYSTPKALVCFGAFVINGGKITANTTQNGAEGIESKTTLTINGGTIEVTTYDDGINAATKITVNGGSIYSYASNNDGMDSNGTFLLTGGTIVTSGASAPEEGFDCDQNNFAITTASGGPAMIGTGGATSTPTAASCTQRTILYKGTGTSGTIVQLKANGTPVMIYKVPRTYSGGGGGGGTTPMTMVISLPGLATGVTYTIHTGGTVSGGTEFHGYYTGGATVTGTTTQVKSFTLGTAVGSVTTP
ncbi:MAG: carbohydrate-binding domain-containing protein [Verrucomicrobia bacterium]|nr:carbohydrate-binding domain-containing protein [Verrucomicrobiota bacterium]